MGRTGRSPGLPGVESGDTGGEYIYCIHARTRRRRCCRRRHRRRRRNPSRFWWFSTSANMSVDVMTSKFGNITLKTSTPRRDDADEDDVAILSSFLPEYLMSPAAASKNKAFECSLKRECRLGDPKATPPGRTTAIYCSEQGESEDPPLDNSRPSLFSIDLFKI